MISFYVHNDSEGKYSYFHGSEPFLSIISRLNEERGQFLYWASYIRSFPYFSNIWGHVSCPYWAANQQNMSWKWPQIRETGTYIVAEGHNQDFFTCPKLQTRFSISRNALFGRTFPDLEPQTIYLP